MLATGTVETPDGRRLPLHSNVPDLECRLLEAWARDRAPRRVLEVGFAYGASALTLCTALTEAGTLASAEYRIVDPFQHTEWAGVGVHALHRAGFGDAYTLHEERSEHALPRLHAEGVRLDFAFLDGWHTFDHALVEFFYVNKMLDVGGVVVFDDVHLPSLQAVAAHVATYPAYRPLPPPPALANAREARVRRLAGVVPFRLAAFEKVAPDDRSWDWHEPF
ncbi:MAG: class I SAM-dependent methyltransferase [Bacteroidota bacterium]